MIDTNVTTCSNGLWLQHDYFYIKNIDFVNYGRTPLMTGCNNCLNGENMNQGGVTYRTEGLKFVNRYDFLHSS